MKFGISKEWLMKDIEKDTGQCGAGSPQALASWLNDRASCSPCEQGKCLGETHLPRQPKEINDAD